MTANKKCFEFNYNFYEDNPEDSVFDDVEFPNEKNLRFSVTFSEDVRWTNVLREFASFLDAVGYVGVSDSVRDFTEERDNKIFNRFTVEDDNEDTSNPGLSD